MDDDNSTFGRTISPMSLVPLLAQMLGESASVEIQARVARCLPAAIFLKGASIRNLMSLSAC
jgi:hypothetical protein